MTFTYNLTKSSLESHLATTVNPQTQTLIEQALASNGLQNAAQTALTTANGLLTTTVVTAGGPYTFNAATTGYTNFTTNDGSFSATGQLFIADAPAGTTVSATDSDGGNIFAIGTAADNLKVTNNGASTDTVYGGGNYGESITLGAGNFQAVAGSNLSTITGGSGADYIVGGEGGRTLILAGTGTGFFSGDTSLSAASSFDTIVAGTGSGQTLGVVSGTNVLYGTAIGATAASTVGNTLWGGAGHDTLYGGGLSQLHAGSGTELLIGGQWSGSADTLVAGAGSDTLSVTAGDNQIWGQNIDFGNNTVYATGANTLQAGSGDDTLWGGGQSVIDLAGGKSLVWAGQFANAADTVNAGSGDALVSFAYGDDVLNGGSGTLSAWTGTGNNIFNLGSGTDTIAQQAGNSSITSTTGHDTIFFTALGSGASADNATIVGGLHTTLDIVGLNALSGATTSTSGNSTTFTFTNGSHLTYSDTVAGGSLSIATVQSQTIASANKF